MPRGVSFRQGKGTREGNGKLRFDFQADAPNCRLWLAIVHQAIADARLDRGSNWHALKADAIRWLHHHPAHLRPGSFHWICREVLGIDPYRVLKFYSLTKEELHPSVNPLQATAARTRAYRARRYDPWQRPERE